MVPSTLANIEAGQRADIDKVAREFWKGDADHTCKAVHVITKTLYSPMAESPPSGAQGIGAILFLSKSLKYV